MKKDNFLIKFIAFLLSIGLWACIISLVFLGGLKPMCTSLVESIIEEELSTNNVMALVENNTEMTPEQQQMLTEVVQNNPEIEQLMDVYLDGVGNMLTTGDMNLDDTSAIYDKLNDDIIDVAAKAKNVEVSQEQRAQIKKELAKKEAELEQEVNKAAKESMASMDTSTQNVLGAYGALFKEETLVMLGVIIAVLCLLIIVIRWKSKGWLTTIGVTGITSSIVILFIPVIITLGEKIALEGRYEIANKDYFVKVAIAILAVGIIMIGVKSMISKSKKVQNEEITDDVELIDK